VHFPIQVNKFKTKFLELLHNLPGGGDGGGIRLNRTLARVIFAIKLN
jgi:hypothetical protein